MAEISNIISNAARSLVRVSEDNIQVATARNEMVQMSVRLDAILVKAEKAGSASDVTNVVIELEIECKTADGRIIKIKTSGVLEDSELKTLTGNVIEKRAEIMRRLRDKIKLIKDKAQLTELARRLKNIKEGTRQLISEVGLKVKEQFSRAAEEIERVFIELGINLPGQKAAASTLAEKEDNPFAGELSLELLDMFQRTDPREAVMKILAESHEEERKMEEAAEKGRQQDRLTERRLEGKREDEKAEQNRIARQKESAVLTMQAVKERKQVAVNYFDRIDAEVNEKLVELDLKRLAQPANRSLV